MWRSVPLLGILAAAYNGVLFYRPELMDAVVYQTTLMSGADWEIGFREAFLACSIAILYVEILKATVTSNASVLDHVLSLGVFIGCLVEFLMVPLAGNNTFALFTLVCLVDVIAGFTVTIAAAKRDLNLH